MATKAAKALKEAGWRLILPEIRQIVQEESRRTNDRIDDVRESVDDLRKAIDDLRALMNDRFKVVESELGLIKEKYDLAKDIGLLQAKVRDLESKLSQRS